MEKKKTMTSRSAEAFKAVNKEINETDTPKEASSQDVKSAVNELNPDKNSLNSRG